jgi:polar amino acid transport system substrate-binding protein
LDRRSHRRIDPRIVAGTIAGGRAGWGDYMLKHVAGFSVRARWNFLKVSSLRRRANIVAWPLWRLLTLGLILLGTSLLISPLRAEENGAQRPKDSQTIIAGGTIRVAITKFDLPAFHWRKPNGDLAGPEIELARLIGRLLKVGVIFVDDCPTFDAVVEAVASGRADIGVSKLSQTPSRILHVQFSEPYLTLRHAFLFDRVTIGTQAEGRPPEEVLRTFNGTLGVIAKSAYVDFAQRKFPDAQIAELQTWEDTIQALVSNRVDAIYRDEFEIRRVLKKNPALNVRFGSAAFTDQKSFLSFAVCESCVRLQQFINYQIAENRVPFTLSSLLASDTGN